MHRSGTSCLTGSLQQAGLQLGEVHTWNRYNHRGNRENQEFVDLNDAVLAANGGCWDAPPERCRWTDAQLKRAQELVAGLGSASIVGFKDPRTLLTLDGWREAIPELEFVGAFRAPRAVCSSLAYRSGMPMTDAVQLWLHYNQRLLRSVQKLRFPILDFDVGKQEYLEAIQRLAIRLGLDSKSANEAPFFEESLRTSQEKPAEGALPWRARVLHWRLKRLSV